MRPARARNWSFLVAVAVASLWLGWFAAPGQAVVMRSGGQAVAASGTAKRTVPAKPALAHIATGKDSLQLLSQSTWVGPSRSTFRLDLAVTASDPAAEDLAVDVYPELITRFQLQEVLSGTFAAPYPYYENPASPLDQLPAGAGGGAQLDIPVDAPAGGLSLNTTGVYPVQVFLQKDGLTQGKPLTTFLVYAAAGENSFKHLSVSLVVPLTARVPVSASGTLGPVPASAAASLDADIADIASHRADVTVEASPSTLEAMERSGGVPKAAVSKLAGAIGAGDELLPATNLPVDAGSLVSSGLKTQLEEQLSSGDATLAALLGAAPSSNTWVLSGGVDQAELGTLFAMGADQVAVPESSLSTPPAQFQKLTFAQPADLKVGGDRLMVIGADSELSQRVADASTPGEADLVAYQVLGELAMIDVEAPSDARGVVILPPEGTAVDPTFLSVLLSGLEGNPLLQAVTLEQEFATVPVALDGATPLVRSVVGPASAAPLAGATQWAAAEGDVAGTAAVFGRSEPFVTGLEERLLVSTSSVWSGRRRAGLIAAVKRAAESELHKLRITPQSITLTSRHGRLPLTVLSSAGMAARVRLVLSSEQLNFLGGNVGAGRCTAVSPGAEQCALDLVHPTTTFQLAVVVRTSGAFQLSIAIDTPNGALVAAGADTVRSTAVSGVGLFLMVGAALFLAVWWVGNARHGRRSRRLVPKVTDAPEGGGEASSFGRGLPA